ncbi:MAG TPA: hypothetical protein VMW68_04445 [Methyloceanibacter sp.]|nr:hypothetical protein [Methyloceanibacter sp.]
MKINPEASATLQAMLTSASDTMDELSLQSAYRQGWWDARADVNRVLELLSAPKSVKLARLRAMLEETERMD